MAEQIRGKGVISGIAVGKVMLAGQNLDGYLAAYKPGSVAEEQGKAEAALAAVTENLLATIDRLRKDEQTEQAAILEAHRMMVQDPMMAENIKTKIEACGSAPQGILDAANEQAQIFEQMEDEYFAARAIDLRDVGKRVAKYVLGVKEPEIGTGQVVLCGEEIEPSVVAGMPTDQIAGVILGSGSATSHVVIDGSRGDIIIRPTEEERLLYQDKIEEQKKLAAHYAALKDLPAVTKDGVRIELTANIGTHMDVDNALTYGAEGVGLFRSEFVFMGSTTIPTEEEQFKAYRAAVEKCGGHICVIRTMDIGGDKPLPYLNIDPEENPFLGYRALRISLDRHDLFLPQIKAILRAGLYGKAAMMVPMVISVSEIQRVQKLVEQAKVELTHEGKEYSDDVQVGIMVETPAAAVVSPLLSQYVDFFSIGTNDLIQYTLAVDRGNAQIAHLYNPFNPAVLRLIQRTIQSARERGIWAGMCGEMASDPYAAVILLGMGITELSMSAPSIPRVKEMIRSVTSTQAKELLADVMKMEHGVDIRAYLHKMLEGSDASAGL